MDEEIQWDDSSQWDHPEIQWDDKPQLKAKPPESPRESWLKTLTKPGGSGEAFLRGVTSPIDAAAQLAPRIMSAMTKPASLATKAILGEDTQTASDVFDKGSDWVDKRLKTSEQRYQKNREDMGRKGFDLPMLGNIDPPRLVGDIAGLALPSGIAGKTAMALSKYGPAATRAIGASAGGAAAGLLTPVNDGADDFALDKSLQVGAGGLLGAAGDVAGRGVGSVFKGVGGKIADVAAVVAPRSEFGRTRLAVREIERAVADLKPVEREMVIKALREGTEIIPGAPPSVVQALAEAQMASGSPLIGGRLARLMSEAEGASDDAFNLAKQQREATLAPFQAAAGGASRAEQQAAIRGLLNQRETTAEPLMSAATDAANRGARTIAEGSSAAAKIANDIEVQRQGLLGELPGIEATKINALQQAGQLQTGAAQNRARVVPREAPGEVEQGLLGALPETRRAAPGQFPEQVTENPFAIPRIPEDGITGQALAEGAKLPINRMAKLSAADAQDEAARELSDIASQAISRTNNIKGTLRELDGQAREISFGAMNPLASRPIVEAVESFSRGPLELGSDISQAVADGLRKRLLRGTDPETGVIDAKTLSVIREGINQDIKTFMKNNPGADKKIASSLGIRAKAAIDDAIESAGGTTWREGLKKYGDISNQITAKNAEQELLKMLNKSTTTSFMQATGDGEAAFLRKLKVSPNIKSLEDLLGKQAYKRIQDTRRQIERDAEAIKITKLPSQLRVPDVQQSVGTFPNTLDPVIGRINFLLRGASQRAQAPVGRRIAELGTQPKQLAGLLSKKPVTLPAGYPRGLLGAYAGIQNVTDEPPPLQFDVKLKGYR